MVIISICFSVCMFVRVNNSTTIHHIGGSYFTQVWVYWFGPPHTLARSESWNCFRDLLHDICFITLRLFTHIGILYSDSVGSITGSVFVKKYLDEHWDSRIFFQQFFTNISFWIPGRGFVTSGALLVVFGLMKISTCCLGHIHDGTY